MLNKNKLKSFFSDVISVAKLKPLMFATMLFSVGYGLVNAIISTVELSLYIGITGSYSIILGFTKLYGLIKYKQIKDESDEVVIKKTEMQCAKSIGICTAVMSFLYFSFAIVSTFFYDEPPTNYGKVMLIFVSGAAFVKIILSAALSLATMKNHSLIIHNIKLAGAALALIALGLTQRAILYYVGYENAKLISGIGGVFFSLCAAAVSLGMFLRHKKSLKK